MFVHPVLFVVGILFVIYLIAADVHMHRRIKHLEKTVRKLEGMNSVERPKHRWEGKEDLS
ncbi:MAG: hypothetical protein ABSE18_01860 [Minisyncoccia bacterium]|jgi:hypothetical protein